ncbi:uncharacterized protein LOC130445245 [Diorhabda sublineata]|uniref:uncharacterized protein LOC130445245 n=1 Tax=Diorhabda sublineata TaxID=1163346 RepID=UPI0024E0635B|nr:uncharacterized protein LOC130445245 [Diorhabda sublineata]XP_056636790.1 uncharacterized protein LOC130445245 [Diorhabda sublineata]
MAKSCYLCDRKASQADNISLHRFPKNLDIRIKWLNACGLTINDDVRRTTICSRHFKAEDICQSNIFGMVKSSIKRNAVPTIYIPNPTNINASNKPQLNSTLENFKVETSERSINSGVYEKDFIESNFIKIEDENNVPDKNTSPSQCQKRKFFDPRYVSEISPTDFSTPKKAKRTLDLIKQTDKRKTEKIKQLQRKIRNLQQKVESLQDYIIHLKENHVNR